MTYVSGGDNPPVRPAQTPPKEKLEESKKPAK